jgi:hypothetical protein
MSDHLVTWRSVTAREPGRGRRLGSMKTWLLLALGVVLFLVGLVWTLQGLGTIAGGFMSGQKLWFTIGIIVGLVGLVLIGSTARARWGRRTV